MSAPSPRHASPSTPQVSSGANGSFRPSPARAASLSAYTYKTRATSQPAGERLPTPGSQPSSGRGSPGMNGNTNPSYGVIGGSRTPGRFAGALASSGTTTRANSFSGEMREPRNASLTRTLSSHAEELPSRSQSTSPFPTFSPSSTPSTSPATLLQQPLPLTHSPPKAEASRSRSQSLAGGIRPSDRPFMMPMSALENTGVFSRTFDKGWDVSPEGNMSPFARHTATLDPSRSHPSTFQGRFRPPDYLRSAWGSSAPESAALSSSVAKALGGTQPSYSTVVGGFDTNGGKSGTSSRRHSVSVVGGPGGRRDYLFGEGGGMSGITSPPGRGLGPLGFSDEELLPERLGNALSLEIDQSRKRGIDIEAQSPKGRDVHASSLPKFHPIADHSRSNTFPSVPRKDPFAPEGPFGLGTSPARGRLDTLQPAGERAPSGDSKGSQRSRFSFDNSNAAAASPARAPHNGLHDPTNQSSDWVRSTPGAAPSAGAVGTMPRGPGAIGGPAPFDPRFVPFQSSLYPVRSFAGPPSPVSAAFPGNMPYGRPPAPFYPQSRPPMGFTSPAGYQPPTMGGFSAQQPGVQGYFPPAPGSPHAPTSPSSFSSLSLADLGRGIPLATLPPTTPLYIVTFKAGRRDVFYCPDPTLLISNGDRVIVEADRGSDLGTVVYDQLSPLDVREWQEKQATAALLSGASQHQPPGMAVAGQPAKKVQPRVTAGELAGADLNTLLAGVGPGGSQLDVGTAVRGPLAKEIMPKRIFAKSAQGPEEQARMMEKNRDEFEAMMICREKVAQRGLPMQIVDAEYQWDRRKLTFYFKADKRVDFRDLTKENFRIFKSRIWMSMVPKDDPRN